MAHRTDRKGWIPWASTGLLLLLVWRPATAQEVGRLVKAETGHITIQAVSLVDPAQGSWTEPTEQGSSLLLRGALDFEVPLVAEGPALKLAPITRTEEGEKAEGAWTLLIAAGELVAVDGRHALRPDQDLAALRRPEAGDLAAALKVRLDSPPQTATQGDGTLQLRLGGRAPGLDAALRVVRDWWLASWSFPRFLDGRWKSLMPEGLDCSEDWRWSVVGEEACVGFVWGARPVGTPVGVVTVGGSPYPVVGLDDGYAVPAEAVLALRAEARPLVLKLFPLTDSRFAVELEVGAVSEEMIASLAGPDAPERDGAAPAEQESRGLPAWAWFLIAAVLITASLVGASRWRRARPSPAASGSGDHPRAPRLPEQVGGSSPAPPHSDALRGRVDRLERAGRTLEQRLHEVTDRLDSAESARAEIADRSGRWESPVGGIERRLRPLESRLSELADREAEARDELGRLEARVGSLEELMVRVERLEEVVADVQAWRQRTELAAAAGDEVGLAASDDPAWAEVVHALEACSSGQGALLRLTGDVAGLDPVLRLLLWYADLLSGQSRIADGDLAPWFEARSRPEQALLSASRDRLTALRRGWVAAFARIHAWIEGTAPDRPLAREEKEALRRVTGLLGDPPGLATEVVKRLVVPLLTEATYLVDAALVERWGLLITEAGQPVRDVAVAALRQGALAADWYVNGSSGDDFHLDAVRRLLARRLGWQWIEIRPYRDDEQSARTRARAAGVDVQVNLRSLDSLADRAGARVGRLAGDRHVFRVTRPALVGPGEALPLECQVLGD